jgi:CheY-like chemotaxis protein
MRLLESVAYPMVAFVTTLLGLEVSWHFTACNMANKTATPCIYEQVKSDLMKAKGRNIWVSDGDTSKRILIVNSESDVSTAIAKALEQCGFKVDSYEYPLIALDSFKPHFYDLVILDIKMPKMNGFSFYREIKKLDKDLKICFLSAGEMYYGVYSDILSRLPANYFIRKSISNEELVNRINEIVDDDKPMGIIDHQ